MPNPTILPVTDTILWVFAGIIISLILPVAVRILTNAKTHLEKGVPKPTLGARITKAWKDYGGNKYLLIAIAAIIVAVVLVFLLGLEFYTIRDAALAGFAWESLVNKLMGRASPAAEN